VDDEYDAAIIEEFRASKGHVGGSWAGFVVILIHHIGARSGVERTTPLSCFPVDDERWAIVASNGGSDRHPGWYHNLKAHPEITVELGAETFTVLAEELQGTARAALWPTLVADVPRLGDLQAGIARQIPVLLLTRGADVGHGPGTRRVPGVEGNSAAGFITP
jgi:deazaflavin-dependent oxidoreductase (nitroreductase family)